MKRTLIGVAAVVAVLSAGMIPHADAALPKLAKPPKIDPKAMVVIGGLFPQVSPADPYVNDGTTENAPWGYGRVAVFFAAPPVSYKIHTVTMTCTPKPGSGAGADYPVDPIVDTFTVTAGATKYTASGTSANRFWQGAAVGGTSPTSVFAGAQVWSLWSSKYPNERAPQLSCAVTLDNTNATNPAGPNPLIAGGGAVASKAPKTTTGPASNCPSIDAFDNGNFALTQPAGSVEPAPVAPTAPFSLNLRVRIDAGVTGFTFCTTDSDAKPKWLTDQAVNFTFGTKVATKTKTVTIKKMKLTAPLSSSLLLQTIGSDITYSYPAFLTPVPAVPGTNKCAMTAPKTAGKVALCTYNTADHTITMHSTDVGLVKPGKPIIGPMGEFVFTYTGTPGDASLTLVESKTTIKFGTFEVAVAVDDTYDCKTGLNPATGVNYDYHFDTKAGNDTNVCFPGQGHADPNHGVPVATVTGLV